MWNLDQPLQVLDLFHFLDDVGVLGFDVVVCLLQLLLEVSQLKSLFFQLFSLHATVFVRPLNNSDLSSNVIVVKCQYLLR